MSSANDPNRSVSAPSSTQDCRSAAAPPPVIGFRNADITTSSLSSCYDQDATRLTCDVLCSLSHHVAAKSTDGIVAVAAPLAFPSCLSAATTAAVDRAGGAGSAIMSYSHPPPPPNGAPTNSSTTHSHTSFYAAAQVDDEYSSITTHMQQHQQQLQQQQHRQYAAVDEHEHEPAKRRYSSSNSNNSSVVCNNNNFKAAACPAAVVASAANNNNKQHQLPMFLSKTYHMIDRCDPEISTWSENGESFVVKNVEKFATNVLPLYFKHSNFSSFARQLNFYGFRKLRTDPILTQDVDPRTSAYIRFYHDKFQKDKPELLQHIRRATKTDQQSRDDLDYLKQEISKLHEANADMKQDFDQRLAELSYECNRRVTTLNADYDKLYSLVQTYISNSSSGTAAAATANGNGLQQQQPGAAVAAAPPPPVPSQNHSDATAVALAALRDLPNTRRTVMPDLLHSLSHAAAVGLQSMVHHDAETTTPASSLQQQQQHAISPSSASNINNNHSNVVVTDSCSGSSTNSNKQEYVLEV